MPDATPRKADQPPYLLADHPALDFLNTLAGLPGKRREWLADGPALLAWEAAAGLLSPEEAQMLRESVPPEALEAAATQARALRTWWGGFVVRHAGAPLAPQAAAELETLNWLLARDRPHRVVSPTADGFAWRQRRDWQAPDALLQPIAERIGDLVCHGDFTAVHQCEGVGCTMWFHDTSAARSRRWCSMALCGNRAKAAAHRARRRATSSVG